jgi:hypothetical protein
VLVLASEEEEETAVDEEDEEEEEEAEEETDDEEEDTDSLDSVEPSTCSALASEITCFSLASFFSSCVTSELPDATSLALAACSELGVSSFLSLSSDSLFGCASSVVLSSTLAEPFFTSRSAVMSSCFGGSLCLVSLSFSETTFGAGVCFSFDSESLFASTCSLLTVVPC